MKITGTSTYINIEIEEKVVRASGEFIRGGFVAYSDSMKEWEPPHQNEEFDESVKLMIINTVTEYCKDKNFKVVFD